MFYNLYVYTLSKDFLFFLEYMMTKQNMIKSMKIQYLNFPSFFFVTFYYFLHFEFLYFVMILIMRADYTPIIKKRKK